MVFPWYIICIGKKLPERDITKVNVILLLSVRPFIGTEEEFPGAIVILPTDIYMSIACVASVSVLFRSKGRAKNGASKRGGGGEETKETLADNTAAKRLRMRDLPHFRFASLAKMSPHESRNMARDTFPGLSLALVRRALSRGTGEWLPFENRYLVGLRSF